MPNTRRRRFSVQNNIGSRNAPNNKLVKNKTQTSNCQTLDDTEIKAMAQNLVAMKSTKSKNMISQITPKNLTVQMVPESSNESNSSTRCIMKKKSTTTVDKDITASISEINVFNILNAAYEAELQQAQEATHATSVPRDGVETPRGDRGRQNRDTPRREKYPRQHRVKVRSPKRRTIIMEDQNKVNDCNKRTVGTSVFHCEQHVQVEIQVQGEEQQEIFNVNDQIEHATSESDIMETTEEDRPSNHSLDDMCRICHGGDSLSSEVGQLISACTCRGTVGRVHVKCLERWLTESGKSRCELCGTRYATRRVHRYGVPKALVMWLLSQNAKQLMVDSLGIMLMSPLAVLAAWLSGRTLAGLMTQESHVTPWPLASTFVLACMTLVCYYCWIVSAATRHALAWWLWYRSQYEVRLQLQDSED